MVIVSGRRFFNGAMVHDFGSFEMSVTVSASLPPPPEPPIV